MSSESEGQDAPRKLKGFLSGLLSRVRQTSSLIPSAPTSPIGPLAETLAPSAPTAPAPRSPEQLQKEVEERQLLIKAYLRNPRLLPEFQDKPFMYKVVSDERAYQKDRLDGLRRELRQIVLDPLRYDPEDPEVQRRRGEREAQIEECNASLTNLFLVLKKITGITKKTGGTDFLDGDSPSPR